PLELCYESLMATGAQVIAKGRLLDLIRRVRIFGICLFRMDLRQDSSIHEQVMVEALGRLGHGEYPGWEESRKIELLLKLLQNSALPDGPWSERARELFDTLNAARRIGPQ